MLPPPSPSLANAALRASSFRAGARAASRWLRLAHTHAPLTRTPRAHARRAHPHAPRTRTPRAPTRPATRTPRSPARPAHTHAARTHMPRYTHTHAPRTRMPLRRRRSSAEDEHLKALVALHGDKGKWALIASEVPEGGAQNLRARERGAREPWRPPRRRDVVVRWLLLLHRATLLTAARSSSLCWAHTCSSKRAARGLLSSSTTTS
jgi:hypothetical protein